MHSQTLFHNKESLVWIVSVKRGLVLHFLFFENEIRDFGAIAKGQDVKLPSEQLKLGRGLIEKMSTAEFEPGRYADEYRERALAMIEKKVEGQEVKVAPPRHGQVVDIFEALKENLAATPVRAENRLGSSASGRRLNKTTCTSSK